MCIADTASCLAYNASHRTDSPRFMPMNDPVLATDSRISGSADYGGGSREAGDDPSERAPERARIEGEHPS